MENLQKALHEFVRAQDSRNPSVKHRQKITKFMMDYWQSTVGSGKEMTGTVEVDAAKLYVVLHQASQLLPSEDDE